MFCTISFGHCWWKAVGRGGKCCWGRQVFRYRSLLACSAALQRDLAAGRRSPTRGLGVLQLGRFLDAIRVIVNRAGFSRSLKTITTPLATALCTGTAAEVPGATTARRARGRSNMIWVAWCWGPLAQGPAGNWLGPVGICRTEGGQRAFAEPAGRWPAGRGLAPRLPAPARMRSRRLASHNPPKTLRGRILPQLSLRAEKA